MFTGKVKELKYVAVEIVPKGVSNVKEIECGAFMGVVVQPDMEGNPVKFVTLLTAQNTIRMYNMNEYNVLAIDALDKDMKYLTVFTNEADDQKEAIEILLNIVTTFSEEGRLFVNDPEKELIDVDSYKELPNIVLTGNNFSDTSTAGTTNTSNGTKSHGAGTHSSTGTGGGFNRYTPPKPEVLNFKRKGKLPNAEKLSRMRELVIGMADGTMLGKVLPVPKCDVEDTKEADTTKTVTAEEKKEIYQSVSQIRNSGQSVRTVG